MTSRTATAIVTGLLLAASAVLDAGETLTLKVTPHVSSAPSTVLVRAMVARHSGNRTLHFEADSGSFYRSSEVQLDGENAALVTEVRLKNLPSGEYTVRVVLRDQVGHETTARQTVLVMAAPGEP